MSEEEIRAALLHIERLLDLIGAQEVDYSEEEGRICAAAGEFLRQRLEPPIIRQHRGRADA